MDVTKIALIGDYNPDVVAHQAIPVALNDAAKQAQTKIKADWLHTSILTDRVADQLAAYHGVWCVPASPYENMAGVLAAIRFARESNRPFFGT